MILGVFCLFRPGTLTYVGPPTGDYDSILVKPFQLCVCKEHAAASARALAASLPYRIRSPGLEADALSDLAGPIKSNLSWAADQSNRKNHVGPLDTSNQPTRTAGPIQSKPARHGPGNGPVVGLQREAAGSDAAAGHAADAAVAARGV